MLYVLFGGTDVGARLATLYGFAGVFFYFFFIVFASMLLMNMLLAILVDAYIAVKTKSFKEPGVFEDMFVVVVVPTRTSLRCHTAMMITLTSSQYAIYTREYSCTSTIVLLVETCTNV